MNAGDNSNVNKTYGPIAASAKSKPNPTPTSVSQLKNVRATLMMVPKDEQGNSLKYTNKDNNIYIPFVWGDFFVTVILINVIQVEEEIIFGQSKLSGGIKRHTFEVLQ